MKPQRALSLLAPWPWLILHGGKNIENRTWNFTFRGEFWIHVSGRRDPAQWDHAARLAYQWCPEVVLPPLADHQVGGIIGRATVTSQLAPRVGLLDKLLPVTPWHFADQYGYVLQHVSEVPFVRCRGQHRFWAVPEAVLAALPDSKVTAPRKGSR